METAVTYRSALSRCEYLPDREWQFRYEVVPHLRPADYMARLQHGWRRFGFAIFRPECQSCDMCRSLRIPAATFRRSRTQRRLWKRNAGEVTLEVGAPVISQDRLDLWARFHRHGCETKGWPADVGDDPGLLLDNPFRTEEWAYYLGKRLVAVSYVDALPGALSAIYCYYDPAEKARSLGTFNILSILEAARRRDIAHVYLGYYVAGCRSMEYKRNFRPNELLQPDGTWTGFRSPGGNAQ